MNSSQSCAATGVNMPRMNTAEASGIERIY
jgi:hypothetical protein